MYFAVLQSAKDILDLLLRLIPIPSLRKIISNGDSPLHAAILERNKVLLEMIVDRRQELLYQRTLRNNTPLHDAAYADGNLPIHLACQKRLDQVVKELLEIEWPKAGLFLNHKGQNIVRIAAMNGGDKITRNLLKHPKIDHDTVNERDVNGDTPLHLAARELRLWTLHYLSRHKMVNVNIVNKAVFTAREVVWMQRRIPRTGQELLANAILLRAGTRRRGNKLGMQSKISINEEWNVKDATNILLIVAILIATVSFTAGFTLPAPYLVLSFFFGSQGDPRLARRAYRFALNVVHVALLAMSGAFQAAIRLIVSNNTLLAHVTAIGFISIFVFLVFLVLVWFPLRVRLPICRQIADLVICIIVYTTYEPDDVSISDFLGDQPSRSSCKKRKIEAKLEN
ncbi:hypothetical protein K1719_047024 [Acacia pycnantha]|nr:hypothetical protein K1719_047024 [Acacia pycnantha]